MEKETPTIAEQIQEFLSDMNRSICTCGHFTVNDFYLLNAAGTGKLDNFIVFRNGGGKPFNIMEINPEGLMDLLEALKGYTFSYKIYGKETILKRLDL